MAKPAKHVEPEFSDKAASKSIKDILAHYENIESARGKFMQATRNERESMSTIYELMASRGISQKAAKTEIKVIRLLEKIRGLYAELEIEDQRMIARLAGAQDDKQQLDLFGVRPTVKRSKPKPKPDPNLETLQQTEAAGSA